MARRKRKNQHENTEHDEKKLNEDEKVEEAGEGAAETEPEPVPEPERPREEKSEGVTLVALRDTQLADGTFVAEGGEVVVSEAVAKLYEEETPRHFRAVH